MKGEEERRVSLEALKQLICEVGVAMVITMVALPPLLPLSAQCQCTEWIEEKNTSQLCGMSFVSDS